MITIEKRMVSDLQVDSKMAMKGTRTQNWLSFALVVLLLADTQIFLPILFWMARDFLFDFILVTELC